MFRAQPMAHATLWFLASEAPDAALLLARHGGFGPVSAADEHLPDAPGERYREIHQEAASRLAKILEHCGLGDPLDVPADAVAPGLAELESLNDDLRAIWQTCSATAEEEARIEERRKRLAALRETLDRLRGLDIDLARLLNPGRLLDARLGQVPQANVKRLGESLALAGYLLTQFDRDGDQAYVVVAGPRGQGEGLGGLLSQAGWRELPVPEELQTHPDAAQRFLEEEARNLEDAHGAQCRLRNERLDRFGATLREARLQLALARPLAEASILGVRGKGRLAVFSGWVPERGLTDLREALESRFQGRYFMATRAPTAAEAGHIPSLLHYPRWLRPFLPLVRSYGVPRYGEFDPALLFAVTYILLFGAMFGDIGHGAVIFLLAAFLGGRLGWLRPVGMAAGASSMGFGLLYGSIFGSEEIIHPLWQSPLHDPGHLLALAVAGGIVFIGTTLVINIYNRLAAGRWLDALCAGNGVAGLVFYLATARGLYSLFPGNGFGAENGALALLGLLTVAGYTWIETRAPLGERLLIMVIETMETATNLFANTLSFLRVAAFSLNHVALALAIFTLAHGLGSVGHGITLVLGNVVIIVLEGGIVAIQALRLMYYEGFSRFFSGDGVEFAPLRLREAGGKE